ncbi:hypothetical protein FS749_000633 [Ceratobasidium sp. UAMH 11750]|nr:hypothetical protein FS749_000633 [Ceratobasidium sp. UAMH 11750]
MEATTAYLCAGVLGCTFSDCRPQNERSLICTFRPLKRNNRLVWSTTTELVDQLAASWAQDGPTRIHDVCEDITRPLALCVIANAGFGQDTKWSDNEVVPANHCLTFKKALNIVNDNIILPLVLPDWAWNLRTQWKLVKQAHEEVLSYLHEMIRSRRGQPDERSTVETTEKYDLFSQLLGAHDADDKLTTEELIGNIFIFLIAGHETTAHALAFLFGLLALYPNEQDKLVLHIEQHRPATRDFVYEDLQKLTYVTATLYETLRLYPPVINIPKYTPVDTAIQLSPTQTLSVPSETRASISVPGLHYNPNYWDDPFKFSPSRFLDPSWNRDAFIPFAVGPRSCIGRRFAETTVVAFLVRFLPKYCISVDKTVFKDIPGESMLERRERLMNAKSLISLYPTKPLLVFTPRE